MQELANDASHPIPCFFHPQQLKFKPLYEWAFGQKIDRPETTARAENIVAALVAAPDEFRMLTPAKQPLASVRATHSNQLVTLYNTARQLPDGETFYPSVFPRELRSKGDPTNIRHAGCYCFDSGTPLSAETFDGAMWSAGCAHEAALHVRKGQSRLAYALSRPPGHHATREFFGGYCYFNNSGIAAKTLQRSGRVAIVDIDFHHGNGTQALFWKSSGVLTVSLHADPREWFPFYCGFANETGQGAGAGYNLNILLPTGTDGDGFLEALEAHALAAVRHFAPDYLIVAAGFDTYRLDPVGGFDLDTSDYARIGQRLGALKLPTVVVQEGGYFAEHLGQNLVSLLRGVRDGMRV